MRDCAFCREDEFQDMIHREAVRSLRSGTSALLLLVDVSAWGSTEITRKIASVLSSTTREIDLKGWYVDDAIVGIFFSELGRMQNAVDAAGKAIIARMHRRFLKILNDEDVLRIKMTSYPLSRDAVSSIAQKAGR